MLFFNTLFVTIAVSLLPVVSAGHIGGLDQRHAMVKNHALKQFNPLALKARNVVDTCVAVNVNVADELTHVLGITLPNMFGKANICLCVGSLPAFIKSNLATSLAVTMTSYDKVYDALLNLLDNCKDKQECSYPANSQQMCQEGDPCSFTCKNNYTRHGKKCTCDLPRHDCNGKCQTEACPSPSARAFLAPAEASYVPPPPRRNTARSRLVTI